MDLEYRNEDDGQRSFRLEDKYKFHSIIYFIILRRPNTWHFEQTSIGISRRSTLLREYSKIPGMTTSINLCRAGTTAIRLCAFHFISHSITPLNIAIGAIGMTRYKYFLSRWKGGRLRRRRVWMTANRRMKPLASFSYR